MANHSKSLPIFQSSHIFKQPLQTKIWLPRCDIVHMNISTIPTSSRMSLIHLTTDLSSSNMSLSMVGFYLTHFSTTHVTLCSEFQLMVLRHFVNGRRCAGLLSSSTTTYHQRSAFTSNIFYLSASSQVLRSLWILIHFYGLLFKNLSILKLVYIPMISSVTNSLPCELMSSWSLVTFRQFLWSCV